MACDASMFKGGARYSKCEGREGEQTRRRARVLKAAAEAAELTLPWLRSTLLPRLQALGRIRRCPLIAEGLVAFRARNVVFAAVAVVLRVGPWDMNGRWQYVG
jgi:hypothetical protein